MKYVDGFVLPIATRNLPAYRRLATLASKVWCAHGALEYRECVGDDLLIKYCVPFPRPLKCKPGETVILAWIVFRSRAHRDRVNAKVCKDPRIEAMMKSKKMPFDPKRMLYGGFRVIVDTPRTRRKRA